MWLTLGGKLVTSQEAQELIQKGRQVRRYAPAPSPSTHQDSPKVPKGGWPVVKLARQRPGNRPLIDSTGRKPHGWKRIETETYIPVSALLSDEAIEAACERFEQALKDEEFDQFEFPESFMRKALGAAIERVGGGQG
jgi:hypothetical protein